MVTVTEQRCSRCHELKPASDYYRHASRSTGLQAYCKPCARAQLDKWAADNPDAKRRADRKRRAQHPELAHGALDVIVAGTRVTLTGSRAAEAALLLGVRRPRKGQPVIIPASGMPDVLEYAELRGWSVTIRRAP